MGKYRVPIHDEIDGEPDEGYVEFDDLEAAKSFAAETSEEVQDASGNVIVVIMVAAKPS